MDITIFLLSFVIILAGCEFFTNGVEWTGKRFGLSEGAVGSVLAAIGTALPETLIPLIAILILGGSAGSEVGVGAILGAPFMLATLALFVCGLSVLAFAKRRNTGTLNINGVLIRRDLTFFLVAYTLAAIAALVPPPLGFIKTLVGFTLLPIYAVYLVYTLKTGETYSGKGPGDLYLDRALTRLIHVKKKSGGFRHEPWTILILVQLFASLAAIIIGASLFVGQINDIATRIGINPLILSLLISPLATELPEKFNSMLWIRARKDTFAIGNITGAMVFQSCIPVTIGILLTTWHLNLADKVQFLEAATIGIALLSGLILYLRSSRREIKISGLMLGGVFYLLFFIVVLMTIY
jgi:cation:H+ antiporter